MAGREGAEAPPTGWEYALSHHLPGRYERTLRLPIGRSGLRVCTRCTGQLIGWIGLAAGALLFGPFLPSFLTPTYQLALAIAPLPAALDWTSQALGRRESSTALRLVSGALLGASSADLVAVLLLRPWWWFAIGAGIGGLYVAGVGASLAASGKWRAVVADHFPGIDASIVAPPSAPPPP